MLYLCKMYFLKKLMNSFKQKNYFLSPWIHGRRISLGSSPLIG